MPLLALAASLAGFNHWQALDCALYPRAVPSRKTKPQPAIADPYAYALDQMTRGWKLKIEDYWDRHVATFARSRSHPSFAMNSAAGSSSISARSGKGA